MIVADFLKECAVDLRGCPIGRWAGQDGQDGQDGQGAASERKAGRERLMCPDCHLLPDPTHLPHCWCRVLFEI